MKYAKKAYQPDWYRSDDAKIYYSATSGSSPFNEWYEFDDRSDALDLIGKAFNSQSFHDGFYFQNDELYVHGTDEELADLQDVIDAESRF
jgi:hypothetical protein